MSGVVLTAELAVCLLDLVVTGAAFHTQRLVIICHLIDPLCSFGLRVIVPQTAVSLSPALGEEGGQISGYGPTAAIVAA